MRYTAVIPLPPAISEEGMKWVDEKVRESAYVVGLAIELDADDDYALAILVQGIEDEITSSGYIKGALTIERPVPKVEA